MKKLLTVLLVALMALALVACGSKKTDETKTEDASATSAYRIAMVTDYGDITDQSFNQATYEACQAYAKSQNLDFTYFKPTGDSTPERVAQIEKAIGEGYNIIVMPGYAFAGAIVEVAPQNKDVKFIALDVSKGDYLEAAVTAAGETYDYNPDNWDLAKYVDLSNVNTIIYQEEIPGFMAGYAAVKLGYKKLGFLGGMAVPAVVRYGYGFVQGAEAAAKELGLTDVEIKYAYGNQFFGDADITAAMDTWYGAGTEVVFACGGGIYTSAAEAAKKVNGKVIGVDVDQAPTIDGAYGDKMTVTSAMKGLAVSTKDALASICELGAWDSIKGQIVTLGLISEDPDKNYVGLPTGSTQFAEGFTLEDYKALTAKLFKGEITVKNDTTVTPESLATVVKVENLGNLK